MKNFEKQIVDTTKQVKEKLGVIEKNPAAKKK
jgi:hypothetical protein